MSVVIASTDPEWPEPLAAMLRERGYVVSVATDVIDAMAALRDGSISVFVSNIDIGEDESVAVLRAAARRFGDDVRRVGVGEFPSPEAAELAHVWVTQPFRYVSVVAAVGPPKAPHLASGPHREGKSEPHPTADASHTRDLDVRTDEAPRHDAAHQSPGPQNPPPFPSPSSREAASPPPVTIAEVHAALERARFEPYATLLDVAPGASAEIVRAAAARLSARFDDANVPEHVADSAHAELVELRAAIEDAADLLSAELASAAAAPGPSA
jgi:hypothetical protein